MKVFESQIDINAPTALVWEHLTAFEHYPEWNPFVLWAKGDLKQGSIVRFQIARQPVPFNGEIITLTLNREFTWEARVPIPGVQPRYIRKLESINNGKTRFINREEFSGVMVPVAAPVLSVLLGPLYEKTCQALKQRVEAAVKAGK
jgi:hypothetical protein